MTQQINKAVFNDAVLNNGGRLNVEQSNRFIDMVVDQPTILNELRVVRMNSPQRKIEEIGFGQRVLVPATEGTDPGESNYKAPTTRTITLTVTEMMAVIKITDDTLENNIEGDSLEAHTMRLLSERTSLDLEDIIVNGDTTSADTFLAQFNGLRAQITTHTVDAAGATITKDHFKQALKAVPNKFIRDRRSWRFYTHYDVETEWVDVFGARQTARGDSSLADGTIPPAYGVPVRGIAMLGDREETHSSEMVDVSDAIFINPQNIIFGIQRDIRVEPERRPRERSTYFVLTLKVDMKLENEEASCKIESIQV